MIAVDVATGYGLDDRGVGFRIPVGSRIFTFSLSADRSGVHQTSYPISTGSSFSRGKAARS
jgi:hypothetical protein